MIKKHVYFIPGLAANRKIFKNISLPKNHFELHFLEWILPNSINETIQEYAQRLCYEIKHKNPILVGVSFGGIMVQEMSKIIDCKKVIIISSIKSSQELPKRLKIAQLFKVYNLLPLRIINKLDDYENYFFTNYLKRRIHLYKMYLSVRNPEYLHWAIFNILNWQQLKALPNIIHIHGEKDEVFPFKHIKNSIAIKNGTHVMILNKAKTISKILEKECTF